MSLTSLYIHIPFCTHRCGYCDFNTFAGIQEIIPAYVHAVCDEIKCLSKSLEESLTIHTIYFGGGTPSLVPTGELEEIINTVRHNFVIIQSPEVTLEANPGTVSFDWFNNVHRLGVNRISLGMQSANQTELKLLERQHTFEDVVRAVEYSRDAGINNLNLDLIYGLPRQSMHTWMSTLEQALSLRPEHLSLYSLTLEHGTPLKHKVDTGKLPKPDPDLAADMYEAASQRLAAAGYIQYEISNWARGKNNHSHFFCKHNLQYWRNLPYLGVGAGSHGYINHYRTVNVANPRAYIEHFDVGFGIPGKVYEFPFTPATIQRGYVDKQTEIGETMMLGLRLIQDGISASAFHQRHGISLLDLYSSQINQLIALGLLEWIEKPVKILRLTPRGRLLGNQVFKEFI